MIPCTRLKSLIFRSWNINHLQRNIKKVHIFATTLGASSLIYAEAFMDEKLPQFIDGSVHAVEFYGEVAKYFVPDNLKTAVKI